MHLYAKLDAHLGRIVHCTSFCAFLLGSHVPMAIGGMWCSNATTCQEDSFFSSLGACTKLTLAYRGVLCIFLPLRIPSGLIFSNGHRRNVVLQPHVKRIRF